MNKIRNKILSKFVEKLITRRIMFKNILTFLETDFRDDSLLSLYNVVV